MDEILPKGSFATSGLKKGPRESGPRNDDLSRKINGWKRDVITKIKQRF